jgi:hypothetical protein
LATTLPGTSRDRPADLRRQRHHLLAIEAVDTILELPEPALRRALAAVRPSTLAEVHLALVAAHNAVQGRSSRGTGDALRVVPS